MEPKKDMRYAELPDVQIDESQIPGPLLPLLSFAKAWGIMGDDALERAVRAASREEIEQAVKTAEPLSEALHDFAFRSPGASATPVPDEVVLFQMFSWSLHRLKVEGQR